MAKKDSRELSPKACANCGNTAWVSSDELVYCHRCLPQVRRWSEYYEKRGRK